MVFDAWHIAGELAKTGFDGWHIFSTANAKVKKLFDRFHVYGAARKTVVDLYHILGPALKAAFDRWHLYTGEARAKKVFDLYRIYQEAGYLIFYNAGDGGPVDYGASVGFTTGTTWSTSGLGTSSIHRFGVRARNELYAEENTNVVVAFETDAGGNEIEGRPNAVTDLVAEPAQSGRIRLSWSYNSSDEKGAATAFRIYKAPDTVDFELVATVAKVSGTITHYEWTSDSLAEGVRRWFKVKACTAGLVEDAGRHIVSAVPDSTPPSGFASVSVEVI